MPSTAEQKAAAEFFLEVVQPKMEALDEAAAIKWNDCAPRGWELLNPWKKKATKRMRCRVYSSRNVDRLSSLPFSSFSFISSPVAESYQPRSERLLERLLLGALTSRVVFAAEVRVSPSVILLGRAFLTLLYLSIYQLFIGSLSISFFVVRETKGKSQYYLTLHTNQPLGCDSLSGPTHTRSQPWQLPLLDKPKAVTSFYTSWAGYQSSSPP